MKARHFAVGRCRGTEFTSDLPRAIFAIATMFAVEHGVYLGWWCDSRARAAVGIWITCDVDDVPECLQIEDKHTDAAQRTYYGTGRKAG